MLLWLLAALAAALFLRVWFQYHEVVRAGGVWFPETDAWHHMRLVDALVHDFPHRLYYDPFAVFGGQAIRTGPLFDLLVAGVALALGGGAPDPHLIDLVGAWSPAVLGALGALPVFALGTLLFGRVAGLWGASIYAVLPGGLLRRSAFGFADHHVLEGLFGTLTLLALSHALRESRQCERSWTDLRAHPRAHARWLGWSAASGVALGLYLLSWTSGVFLVGILFVWLALESLAAAFRGVGLAPLTLVGTSTFAVALAMVLPFVGAIAGIELTAQALGVGAAAGMALGLLAPLLAKLPRWGRVSALLAAGGAALVVALFAASDPTSATLAALRRLVPAGPALTVGELRPLFAGGWRAGWNEYAAAWPFALGGLALAVHRLWRRPSSEMLLVAVFAVASLAATLLQLRFSLYFGIGAALLGGFALDRASSCRVWRLWRVPRWLAIPALGAALFVPTTGRTLRVARLGNPLAPWWHEAAVWLGANTPDPFPDPGAYFSRHQRPPHGAAFRYPESAYSILAWWDYGYLIERLAHRIPTANPSQQGVEETAAFLVAGSIEEAKPILERLRTRYVVVDSSLVTGIEAGTWPAIVTWARRDPREFIEAFKVLYPDGKLGDFVVFHPAFYRSMAVRLWIFGGHGFQPRASTWLMTWAERRDSHGTRFRQITWLQAYATWEGAAAALADHPGAQVVGLSMALSPVPLEKLESFHDVYDAKSFSLIPLTRAAAPVVRIFEYHGRDGAADRAVPP